MAGIKKKAAKTSVDAIKEKVFYKNKNINQKNIIR
jgi:hypothetical protein